MIYRKQKKKVVGQLIWDAMSAGQDPNVDACAWFSGNMTLLASQPKKAKGSQRSEGVQYELQPAEETKESASFEYLPSERVHHLTYPGQYTVVLEQIYDGILQKFVAPREAHDSIIRAIWSPTACVCERRTNRNLLSDMTKPLSSRIASFENANFWLNSHQMLPEGSVVVERLTAQCEAVVNHLRDTTSGRVSVARMELYFKLDSNNRIWLMYCNTLRLDRTVFAIDRSPSMQREMPHRQYSLQDPTRHSDSTRINWDDNPFMCALTGKSCSGRQRMDVSYKLLIQAWFREVAELANENDRIGALDNIPPAIRRANPNITRDYYLRMRSQPVFLMKTAPVSADAAAELIPAVATDLARTIARPTSELAKSAGGAALAEPMPIIAAAHARDPMSLSFHRQQRNGGQRRDAPSSVRMIAGSMEDDNGLLYEPGAVVPSELMPRPKSPPAMVPVYASGATQRIPARQDGSRSARLAVDTRPLLQTNNLAGQQYRLYSTSPQGVIAASPAPPTLAPVAPATAASRTGGRGAGGAGLGIPAGTDKGASPLKPRASSSRPVAQKPLFVAPPRTVPLHAPRQSQHSPGRVTLEEAAEAELMAALSATHTKPHQSIHVYMPQAKKRGSARANDPALSSSIAQDLAGSKSGFKGTGAKGGTQSLQAMKDAYASAEATTQELLAQAHEILREPGPPAKPISTANSTTNGIQGSGEQTMPVTNGDPSRPPSSGRRAVVGGGEAGPEKGGSEGVGAQGEGSTGAEGAGSKGRGSTEAEGMGNKGGGSTGESGGAEGVGGNSFTNDEHALLSEALMEKSQ
eukprot:CAMPEP_0202403126 /NCGR_PEP_ID=MMETSP1128-20130828/4733_1 /ASSEMBLY_ACC=CAM_ASM_000463 /TAXON_ID=3047 /ORGANISM="Dunaliella tertiolecta, Strain CCMP1320" /LENGTH=806 /DNA_ID=CAMNT_0049007321 /DNA_START=271 /DNA_END=2691 /DNA_ORIENTATION=+